jgi:hypothetical protein
VPTFPVEGNAYSAEETVHRAPGFEFYLKAGWVPSSEIFTGNVNTPDLSPGLSIQPDQLDLDGFWRQYRPFHRKLFYYCRAWLTPLVEVKRS